jgi:hypothetical protein
VRSTPTSGSNEHFIRGIGAFQIGLGAVLLLTLSIDDGPIGVPTSSGHCTAPPRRRAGR